MRILTVRQPWAWAIIHGGKDVENRVRNIAGDYRGPVAIHAGATRIADFDPGHANLWPFNRAKHDLGAIIGVVDLADVHDPTERLFGLTGCQGQCTSWADEGLFHLLLANPRPLAEPIPFKGALGLRRLDADTIRQIEEHLA
jgi:hypothetical protein